jgi:hypothetical protein
MARESKAAREARETAELDAAECMWHQHGDAWRRRRGAWWLRLEQRHKPLKREMAWMAILSAKQGVYVATSAHLGDVAEADMDAMRAAADAWLVDVTGPLMQLVEDGARRAVGEPIQ